MLRAAISWSLCDVLNELLLWTVKRILKHLRLRRARGTGKFVSFLHRSPSTYETLLKQKYNVQVTRGTVMKFLPGMIASH